MIDDDILQSRLDPKRLAALRHLALLDSPIEIAFDRLTHIATLLLKSSGALVTLIDQDRQFFKSCIGLPEPWQSTRETPLSHSFCQYTMTFRKPLIVADARLDPLFSDNLAIRDLHVIAYAGFPLITSAGYAIGAFCVIDSAPRVWTEEEIDSVQSLGAAVLTEIELRYEITERIQLTKQLQLQTVELEARNSDLDAYAYTIAHDLKTPLSVILNSTYLLTKTLHKDLVQQTRQPLNRIQTSVEKMQRMLDQLLELTKLNNSTETLSMIDVNQIVQSVLSDFTEQITAQAIVVEVDPHLHPVLGYNSWLEVLFSNLITNAIKYLGQNNPTPHITVRSSLYDTFVRYEIQDNGIGISAKDQQSLFKMFSRLNTVDTRGSGLGLYIVERTVMKLHGRIGVESIPGKGSTFWFTLPLVGS